MFIGIFNSISIVFLVCSVWVIFRHMRNITNELDELTKLNKENSKTIVGILESHRKAIIALEHNNKGKCLKGPHNEQK